jgi:hypothetical protein
MRASEFVTKAAKKPSLNSDETHYDPPSLDVGDSIRVGKFKNVNAVIQGFGKDKNNQPTIQTTKGTQQLFKPRIMKLMPESTGINGIGNTPINDVEIINHSSEVGHIDDTSVFMFELQSEQMYFIKNESKIEAFVVVDSNNHLRGMKNISGRGGQITALVMFVARDQIKGKLKIAADEKLSSDGFRWLIAAINHSPLVITDLSGKVPDLPTIKQEWESAKTGEHGRTAIFIESRTIIRDKPNLLMPMYKWLGRTNIL